MTDAVSNDMKERLLPFQADFVSQVLAAGPSSLLVLQAPVGSGTTHTLCAAVAEGVRLGTFRRVLFLTPTSTLTAATVRRLREQSVHVPVVPVDRQVLREYEAEAPSLSDIWPETGVFVASIEFAKRPELGHLFADTSWDLVIVEEAHRLAKPSARREFVERLLGQPQSLVVCAYHTAVDDVDQVLAQLGASRTIRKIAWSDRDFRTWDGGALNRGAANWKRVRYRMNEREAEFYAQLERTALAIDRLHRGQSIMHRSLMNRAMSCLYSVERALMDHLGQIHQRRNDLVHGAGIRLHQQTLCDAEEPDSQLRLFTDSPESPGDFLKECERVMALLQESLKRCEELETDSKSQAALDALRQTAGHNQCVVSQYSDTISYLQTVFGEEEGVEPVVLAENLSAGEFESRLVAYRERGGLLLATDASISGVDLPDVDVVLHYDLPDSPEALEDRTGRFLRLGRKNILTILTLVEENSVTARLWDKLMSMALSTEGSGSATAGYIQSLESALGIFNEDLP